MNFIFSKQAQKDLDDIWYYIAADSVNYANKVEDDIIAKIFLLAENPYLGHKKRRYCFQ